MSGNTDQKDSTAAAATFYGTFAVILVVMGGLIAIDVYLAGIESNETQAEASRYFREGQTFAAAGDYERAIERFRTAASVSRGNNRVEVALADALLAASRDVDARVTADEILDADPTNADAALVIARVLAGEGNIEDASTFYHRAIYSRWLEDAAQRRLDTRLELADLLAANNNTEELLPELVALQDQASEDLDLKRRIARLYVAAGGSERASEMFREILEAQPRDADAYAGLGEAEFVRANYRTARTNFETALRLSPDNPEILAQLDLADQVLTLDPLSRGVSAQQRYDRSRRLLELAAESLESCAGAAPDEATTAALDRAEAELSRRVPVGQRNDAVDAHLTAAEPLWALRVARCGPPDDVAGKAVGLVLTRAAQ